MDKKLSRQRRAQQTRLKQRELRATRLSVYRTNQHMYATVLTPDGGRVLATASTLEPALRLELGGKPGVGADVDAASLVGRRIAERALAAGINEVSFDRSGFRYHGRVKALADAAREAGLKF